MEYEEQTLMSVNNSKLWNELHIYNTPNTEILCKYETRSSVIKHIISTEESELYYYRNKISEYENEATDNKNWEYYKKIVNPYELVYTQKKYDDFPHSICNIRPLSRSYFKMVEMLNIIKFFKGIESGNVRSAHVCEGPGGFIEALFSQSVLNECHIETSVAMTLKSHHTTIPGWKRAYNFLQKHKNIKILYGDDNTGNIMKPENQQYFIDYCSPSKMDIFTADGGFDFSCNYAKQEEMIFPLLLASTKIGFEVLKKGGTFILKLFDFYEKSTVDLLYLLASHFTEWTLYKPAMSRPCNPEQYFIGKDYKGCANEILDVLRIWCCILDNKQPLHSLFTVDLPPEFVNTINNLRTYSFKRQIAYLEKVFDIIDHKNNDIIREYLAINEQSSLEWCIKFKMPISVYYHATEV